MSLAIGETPPFDERGEFMAAARLEYLQDEKGIYGLSIPLLTYDGASTLTYILRPDRLGGGLGSTESAGVSGPALQVLPRRIFRRSHHMERQLTAALADAMHRLPALDELGLTEGDGPRLFKKGGDLDAEIPF